MFTVEDLRMHERPSFPTALLREVNGLEKVANFQERQFFVP